MEKSQESLLSWARLIYGTGKPAAEKWETILEKSFKDFGQRLSPEEVKEGNRLYFDANPEAEAYFSMICLYHNICESVREPEIQGEGMKSNENTSYKVKIENALKLPAIRKAIKDMEATLFQNNQEAIADFNAGKKKTGKLQMDELLDGIG